MKERQIEIFSAVMNYGGISRASDMLNISQPAVSRMIADLESETGLQLFRRSGRAVQPTPEAHQLKREVDTFFIGLDRIAMATEEIRELRRGHVRLTVMPAIALSVAPTLLRAFTERHPTVKTTLDVHTSPRIAELIASGQFDLGIGHLPEARPEVAVLSAWHVDCVCVLPAGHPLSGRDQLTPGDLADQTLVALSYHTETARRLARAFADAGVKPRIQIESQPSYAACAMAAEGLGIAIVDALTAAVVRSDTVTVVPFAPATPFEFKLLRPASATPSAVAQKFTEVAHAVLDANRHAKRDA